MTRYIEGKELLTTPAGLEAEIARLQTELGELRAGLTAANTKVAELVKERDDLRFEVAILEYLNNESKIGAAQQATLLKEEKERADGNFVSYERVKAKYSTLFAGVRALADECGRNAAVKDIWAGYPLADLREQMYRGFERQLRALVALDPGCRPIIVCLCGSTRFWRTFQKASLQETLAGKIVLSIGAASGTDDDHFGNLPREEYDRVKEMLDALHMQKIEMADEVLILNVGGYVGNSTRNELAYAVKLGKVIRWWEPDEAIKKRVGE